MQFFNRFRQKTAAIQETVKEPSKNFLAASAKSVKLKNEVYASRENFEFPDATLYEVRRAVATDSYIAESLNKYKEKVFKANYVNEGEEGPRSYLEQRLSVMSFQSGIITDVLFQEMADDLITYYNAFLLKLRTDDIPFVHATGFFKDKPVGGYMRLDPCEIIVVKDKYGNILRYEVEQIGRENRKIDKEDIVHIYMNRKAGESYGTPRLEPVLEDVKALRDIEGDVLTLIHRFCFPLYHVRVGLPQQGYAGTETDISLVRREIEEMSEDGMLITNEKVEIKTVGAENNALDVANYLNYFEKRVFSGLNTSDTLMGRDASSNPDSLQEQIHDTVKHVQRTLSLYIENFIYNELLLEGGFNPILNPLDKVALVFNEISLDTKVKIENHEMLKYQSNIQSLDETRKQVGKKEDADRANFYVENVTNDSALKQIYAKNEAAMELARVQASLAPKTTTSSSNDAKKSGQGNGKTAQKKTNQLKNNNRPQNQHGIYSVKIRESLKKIKKEEEIINECYKIFDSTRNEVLEEGKTEYFLVAKEKLKSAVRPYFALNAEKAIDHFMLENPTAIFTETIDTDLVEQDFLAFIDTALDQLINDVEKSCKDDPTEHSFDRYSYRIRFMIVYWGQKYFWYLFCLFYKNSGTKKLYVHFNRKEEAKQRKTSIQLDHLNYKDIPPFHPFCKCSLSKERKEEI